MSEFELNISGIFSKILLLLLVGILAWAYQVIRPPPPKICGSPDGPPVTASRIKLRDGRHLAYKEHGVTRDLAKFKIIVVHGFRACRHNPSVANHLSPVLSACLSYCYYSASFWSLSTWCLSDWYCLIHWWVVPGNCQRIRGLPCVIWQTRLWREWSSSKTNIEKFSFRYWRTCRSTGTWIQILCNWLFHGGRVDLELSQVHSSQVLFSWAL